MSNSSASPDYPTVAFLDRDGTLGPDVGYCSRPEDFTLFPEVSAAIRLLNDHGVKVAIVTNQSGIARGYFDERTLSLIHGKILRELKERGARIDTIVYCPHHPDDGCTCRKPRLGMFRTVLENLRLDRANAYVVGDNQTDMAAGETLGAGTIFVATGVHDVQTLAGPPDYTAENLLAAARWIIEDAATVKHPVERSEIRV